MNDFDSTFGVKCLLLCVSALHFPDTTCQCKSTVASTMMSTFYIIRILSTPMLLILLIDTIVINTVLMQWQKKFWNVGIWWFQTASRYQDGTCCPCYTMQAFSWQIWSFAWDCLGGCVWFVHDLTFTVFHTHFQSSACQPNPVKWLCLDESMKWFRRHRSEVFFLILFSASGEFLKKSPIKFKACFRASVSGVTSQLVGVSPTWDVVSLLGFPLMGF